MQKRDGEAFAKLHREGRAGVAAEGLAGARVPAGAEMTVGLLEVGTGGENLLWDIWDFSKDLSTDSWCGESQSGPIQWPTVPALGHNRGKVGHF